MEGRLPHMVDIVYTGLLITAIAAAGAVAVLVVYRLFKAEN